VRRLASTDRLGVLDGLRGLAILMVVWYHLWLVSGYTIPLFGFAQTLVQNGFLGVDLFFFLSGFCIALPYARARRDGKPAPRLAEFVSRRVWKIAPSYLLALAIFALVFHDRFGGPLQELAHLAAHATFVHVFFPATFGSFSGPLWTLGIEVQFYALFALLAPLVVRRPFTVYAAFVLVSGAYRATIAALGYDTDFGWVNQLPAVLDIFGAGIAAAFVFTDANARGRAVAPVLASSATALAAGLAILGLCVAISVAANGGDEAMHRWLNAWRGAFGPVFFVATLGVALGPPLVQRVASVRPLQALSLVSYSAYLFNLEIVVAIARLGLPPFAIFWFGALGTLAISALVTFGFERPIQRFGARPWTRTLAGTVAFPRLGEPAEAT